MTKDANETATLAGTPSIEITGAGLPAGTQIINLNAGIEHIRQSDPDALRIWTVKGPKETGGTIGAVFLPGSNEVVILHQLASGRFGVFKKEG